MAPFSLEELDRHLESLGAQLRFLQETLVATDHNAPDWVATDLISLRNKSGRLQDDMQRFRDQLESEGLGVTKTSNKRLSLEGAKPPEAERSDGMSASGNPPQSTPAKPSPLPQKPWEPEPEITGPQIDISEEVNRRLHESRLRRLMDSPSTAQKRKYDTFEDTRMESAGDSEDDKGNGSERDRTPVKRLKFSGSFEPMKRKEQRLAGGDPDERNPDRTNIKRRRLWSSAG